MTTFQADASDEDTIAGVCKQALQEEGRLDVFFANVRYRLTVGVVLYTYKHMQAGVATHQHVSEIGSDEFMRTLKINVLS